MEAIATTAPVTQVTSQVATPPATPPVAPAEPQTPPQPEKPKLDFATELVRIEKQKRQLQRQVQEFEELKRQAQQTMIDKQALSKDPLGTLKQAGVSVESLLEALATGEPQPKAKDNEALESLKAEIEALKAEKLERDRVAETAKKEQEVGLAVEHIAKMLSNSEEYELVNHFGLHRMIYDIAANQFEQSGSEITPDIKAIARELENRYREDLSKALKTKAARSLVEKDLGDIFKPKEQSIAQQTIAPTITSQTTAGTQPAKPLLSDDESKRALAAMLKQKFS